MKKYLVHYVRVENQLYLVEVEAKNEAQAREMASDNFFEQEYKVVHAEEFIHQVDEIRPTTTLCQTNAPSSQDSTHKTKTASSVCRFTQPQP